MLSGRSRVTTKGAVGSNLVKERDTERERELDYAQGECEKPCGTFKGLAGDWSAVADRSKVCTQ
eukprot:5414798-Amphidinium_carterae.1